MKISAEIKVKGTKPLLFHTFPIETLTTKASKDGADEWKSTVLMKEGQGFI